MVIRFIRVCNTTLGRASYPIPCSVFVHVMVLAPLNCVIISTTRWAVNGYVSFFPSPSLSSHETLNTEHARQLRTRRL